MKRDQVLDEEEKRQRFSKRDALDVQETNSNEDNDDDTVDSSEDNQNIELEEDFDFDRETSAIDDVEKIHKELSIHCSILDPITGIVKENINSPMETTTEKKLYHENDLHLGKEPISINEVREILHNVPAESNIFDTVPDLVQTKLVETSDLPRKCYFVEEFHYVKNVNVVNEPLLDPQLELEVEVIDDTFEYENINLSFSVRELENLYTIEEINYFNKAFELFERFMQGSPTMRAAFMNQALQWTHHGPSTLSLELFKYTMNQSRSETFRD